MEKDLQNTAISNAEKPKKGRQETFYREGVVLQKLLGEKKAQDHNLQAGFRGKPNEVIATINQRQQNNVKTDLKKEKIV